MDLEPSPRPGEQQQHDRIARRLAEAGFALPGTVVTRQMRCGKPGCRCKAEPPQLHGPYYQWTRKVGGKTVTRFLTDDQLARYEPWFANAQRLRDLPPHRARSALAPRRRAHRGLGAPAVTHRPSAPPTGRVMICLPRPAENEHFLSVRRSGPSGTSST